MTMGLIKCTVVILLGALVLLVGTHHCFASKPQVDVCHTERINVTGDESRLITNGTDGTENTYCSIDINTMEGNATSVRMIGFGKGNQFSYTYLEAFDKSEKLTLNPDILDPENCDSSKAPYLLFDKVPSSCSVVVPFVEYRLHFRHIQADLTLQGTHSNAVCKVDHVTPQDDILNGNATCHVKAYDMVKQGVPMWRRPDKVSYDLDCPVDCICSLGISQWTVLCENVTSNQTHKSNILIIYDSKFIVVRIASAGLTHLVPHAFLGLNNLKELYLSNNKILHVRSDIFIGLNSLFILDLASNGLAELPANSFGELTQLKDLKLGRNIISTLFVGVFYGLSGLEKLRLEFNEISRLEMGLFDNLNNLRILILDNNNLSILAKRLFINNVQLSHVYLSSNSLTHLHQDTFDSNPELLTLHIDNNNLTYLSSGLFSNQGKLREIYVNHNRLRELVNGTFVNLFRLNNLYLDHNEICEIQDGVFNDVNNIIILNLEFNKLHSLPEPLFGSLGSLHILKLNDNALFSLPKHIFLPLSRLSMLYIQNNQILELPYSTMENLWVLNADQNNISTIPEHVFYCKSLKTVNLSDNKLIVLPLFGELSELHSLFLSFNLLTHIDNGSVFDNLISLTSLFMDHNYLDDLPIHIFKHLQTLEILDMTTNLMEGLHPGLFRSLHRLTILNLADNRIKDLTGTPFNGLLKLKVLNIQGNFITSLSKHAFDGMIHPDVVNMSGNNIEMIEKLAFQNASINLLDLSHNSLHHITKQSFTGLQHSTILLADEFGTCCFAKDFVNCISKYPRQAYLTCKRMLNDIALRVCIWILGITILLFNAVVFCIRCFSKDRGKVQSILILHLSLSDFLMGINMIIIAVADAYYANYFPSYADSWRQGIMCKLAGALSLLSSEASVFLLTLITFDRFQGVKYPLSSNRMRPKYAKFSVCVIWCVAILLSVTPVVLSGIYQDVYEMSEVCVGMPIVKRPVTFTQNKSITIDTIRVNDAYGQFQMNGPIQGTILDSFTRQITQNINYLISDITDYKLATYFSIIVFIGINLICFIFILVLYIDIFYTIRKTMTSAGRNPTEKDEIRRAMKVFSIVLTDFCCWVPLDVVCICVQSGLVTVDPVVYAWTVALILPINSAINPFLYTLVVFISDVRASRKKTRGNG